MASDDDDYGLSMDDARRLKKMLTWFETHAVFNRVEDAPPPTRILQPLRHALTTSVITARSGTTKGHGTVTFYTDDQSGTGVDVSLLPNVVVTNGYSQTVAPGKWVLLGTVDGKLSVCGSDC